MGRFLGALIAASLTLSPMAAGAAEVVWTLSKKNGRAFLGGMPNEPEVDYEFWAHCRADGAIDVGAAAESHVGKGGGEAVTLKFASGLKSATLAGVSRHSQNSEMTGGVELRATVSRDHPVFAVLGDGGKIAVSGPIKPLTWGTKGLKEKIAAFVKACK